MAMTRRSCSCSTNIGEPAAAPVDPARSAAQARSALNSTQALETISIRPM